MLLLDWALALIASILLFDYLAVRPDLVFSLFESLVVFPFSLDFELVAVLLIVELSLEAGLLDLLNSALVLLQIRPIFFLVDVFSLINIQVVLIKLLVLLGALLLAVVALQVHNLFSNDFLDN